MRAPTIICDPVIITSGYRSDHLAIDLVNMKDGDGLPVLMMAAGEIKAIGKTRGSGANYIGIDLENGLRVYYVHTTALSGIQIGRIYAKGEPVGCSDNSGKSQGIHLHLMIHKKDKVLNPIDVLNEYKIAYQYHPDIAHKYER